MTARRTDTGRFDGRPVVWLDELSPADEEELLRFLTDRRLARHAAAASETIAADPDPWHTPSRDDDGYCTGCSRRICVCPPPPPTTDEGRH